MATPLKQAPPKSLVPDVMPLDRERWKRQLDLSVFVNAFYQSRDVESVGGARTVLVIGPGQGLANSVLAWRGFDVTTFDIDETFRPDHQGSVHDMQMFGAQQFDVAIASHVLEHLPLAYLDPALAELARVARYSLVYLPVAGRHFQVRFMPGFKGIDMSLLLDVFNVLNRPDGVTPRYCAGQHYWEIGRVGFHVRDLRRRFISHFEIVSAYRNRDWTPSYNFILRSKFGRLR